ncbi:porin, partial [Alcaligenaceae bacterium SAGV5]|nr:porin [Alcaligenaceae bacterium SAGV5]
MKKSALLVLCLGAAGAAHAQNNVTLYGVVTGGAGGDAARTGGVAPDLAVGLYRAGAGVRQRGR